MYCNTLMNGKTKTIIRNCIIAAIDLEYVYDCLWLTFVCIPSILLCGEMHRRLRRGAGDSLTVNYHPQIKPHLWRFENILAIFAHSRPHTQKPTHRHTHTHNERIGSHMWIHCGCMHLLCLLYIIPNLLTCAYTYFICLSLIYAWGEFVCIWALSKRIRITPMHNVIVKETRIKYSITM